MAPRNRLLVFLFLFLAGMLLTSCGIFKKSVNKTSSESYEHLELTDRSEYFKLDSSVIITRGRTEIEMVLDREGTNTGNAVDDLLSRVGKIKVTTDTEGVEQKNTRETGRNDINRVEEKEQATKEVHRDKDSDTTIGANLPWWVWVIGGLTLLAGIFIFLKRVGV